MAGHGQGRKKKSARFEGRCRQASVSSGTQMNLIFFDKDKPHTQLSYTNTYTWKSQEVRDRDEYLRVRQRVRHLAPEQFKDEAKPIYQPCEIFPKTVLEWKQHKTDLLAMVTVQKLQEAKAMVVRAEVQRNVPKGQRVIKSVFGEGGKIFRDGRGPVLCLPTIWSAEYAVAGLPQANWPNHAELHWDGDNRENTQARTRCGRFLPPPRCPAASALPFQDQPVMKRLPLDQTGPIFDSGPFPAEIQECNADMDHDAAFEDYGAFLLGGALMEEIGEWRPTITVSYHATQ